MIVIAVLVVSAGLAMVVTDSASSKANDHAIAMTGINMVNGEQLLLQPQDTTFELVPELLPRDAGEVFQLLLVRVGSDQGDAVLLGKDRPEHPPNVVLLGDFLADALLVREGALQVVPLGQRPAVGPHGFQLEREVAHDPRKVRKVLLELLDLCRVPFPL